MLDHDEQTLIAVLGASADALQVNRTLQKQIGGHSGSNQRAPYSLTADGDEKRVSQDKRLLRLVRAQYLELKASVEAPADQPRIGPFTKAICRILPVSGSITAIAANSDQRGRAPIEAVLACAQVCARMKAFHQERALRTQVLQSNEYLTGSTGSTSTKREVVYISGTVVPAFVMAWTMTTATTRKYQD